MPRIADFRPWLEQQASQRMGISVRIGDIVARSNGLIPSVELRDVRLLDADGRESLRLPSVLAALSPRSAFGLGFEQLYIDAPELAVRRSADGRIWIAGFALPGGSTDDSSATDWVFSQTELVVRHGKVRWTDELRGVPTLELGDVDVVVRNKHLVHSMRVDADPPPGWGTRLSLSAKFQQPLFSRRNGDWRNWMGQLYAEADQVDLELLRNYVDLGVDLSRGAGSLRAWVDVDHAQAKAATVDLALQAVTVKVAHDLDALDLVRISGRLGARRLDGGYELSAQALSFDTRDGLNWPGGNLQLSVYAQKPKLAAHGTLVADRLDLAALAEVASRVPLDEALHAMLQRVAPKGLVEKLLFNWQGELAHPASYALSGRVAQLALAAQPSGQSGIPGLHGASADFALNQGGGKVSLQMQNGALEFPGIFDNPVVPMDTLSADLQWTVDGQRISVEANRLRFANTDAQGDAQIKWQSATVPRGGTPDQRFPGVLDLQGTLSRANVAAVPRYLPKVMNKDARDYLAQALVAGEGSNVRFRLKGDLDKFPFESAKQGDFRITADVRNVSYAYAPALVMPKDSPPWPLLTQVAGEFVLDHDQLQVKAAKGLLSSGTALQFNKTDVTVSRLYTAPVVAVAAEARGPLAEALTFVNSSPVGGWLGNALARSTVTGVADYKIKLNIPVDHVDKSTAQGSVALTSSDFQLVPGVPRLARIKGLVNFTDTGFALSGVQARILGGDVRVEGGMVFGSSVAARNAPGSLRFQGVATSEGLRQASELGLAAKLAQFSNGSAAYSATLSLHGGVPELLVNSSLIGMAINLPEPFGKSPESPMPLRLESSVVRASQQAGARLQDQWQVDIGKIANVTYVRDISGAEPRVVRGAIGVGLSAEEAAPMPADGVAANISLNRVDVDAWSTVVSRLTGNAPAGTPLSGNDSSYLPTTVALRAKELLADGRKFNQILVGGARDGLVWRGNVDASELNGYVEYRQSTSAAAGRVYARLSHLIIGQSVAQDVENILDQQPASIPALDVVVDDFELRGKKLGRLDVQAVNLGGVPGRDAAREWRLNRFNIATPEATLTASGNWVNVNAQTPGAAVRSVRERRRTVLNFKLDVADSGDLLKRMGMPGVVAKGRGKVEGQVSWLGSPFSPDYASMGGGFNLNMESGQFLKADPGIAKLLGVLSLQSLPRRLTLDFRDVFSEGFAFDFVRGDFTIEQGIAHTSNLQMKGVNAAVMMEGQADIAKETQLLKVLVIPEINLGSASLLYSAINPVVGLTTFLANVILRRPLIDANTQEFTIDGSWVDPRVTRVERKADVPAAAASSPAK